MKKTLGCGWLAVVLFAGSVSAQEAGGELPAQSRSANPAASAQEGVLIGQATPELIDDVWVPTRDAGILRRLLVAEGDQVDVGTVIAELDDELHQIELKAAKEKLALAELRASDTVDIEYSQKSEAVAQATLARSLEADRQYTKAITKTELDKLTLEHDRARLSIEKAEFDQRVARQEAQFNRHEADAAGVKLQYRTIHSPIQGIVVQKIPQAGEWVNAGAPLVRIIRLDRLRIRGVIDYRSIDQSFVGRKAVFEPYAPAPSDGPPVAYQGTIQFVSSEVLPNVDKIEFFFDVDNPGLKLRRGEPGEVRILPPATPQ
jgi:multidrug efflux pump subunit AcrA (membrane-fusion protein)